ncbi:MAG: hypothetical protein ACI30W_08420 [Muribaculaceae bacterium]
MNRFFTIAMRGLAFVFLAAAIIVVFYYLSLSKYEAEGLGGTTIAAVLSCIFFAGASWTCAAVLAHVAPADAADGYEADEYEAE